MVVLDQRVTPHSPPPPPKPPSPSFELGLSSFPPLPGAAGQLRTDDVSDSRLVSSVVAAAAMEKVRASRDPHARGVLIRGSKVTVGSSHDDHHDLLVFQNVGLESGSGGVLSPPGPTEPLLSPAPPKPSPTSSTSPLSPAACPPLSPAPSVQAG